ncbi:MAG TPA: MBL fold metallo-hydrolase [Myxococcota bacterium]|nr:MBL fold metallo-hydrolase [Myxococcota bacterium]
MRIGAYEALAVLEGTFLLDGGAMFGIVPRPLWSRYHAPDEQGRIVMALRALLLVGRGRRILVDCGIGRRFGDKQQKIYRHLQNEGGIAGALARLGFATDDITDVIATHLHFDHVGGMLTREDNGGLRPTFSKARLHVQEECFKWAVHPSAWDGGSFFGGDFAAWEREFDLRLARGDCEIAPGVRVKVVGGHTPGQQVVVVEEGPGALVYCADLIPTAAHIRLPYIMAYDQRPILTLEEKKVLLARALEENWVLFFEHDPKVTACRLEEKNGEVVAGEGVCLNLPAGAGD